MRILAPLLATFAGLKPVQRPLLWTLLLPALCGLPQGKLCALKKPFLYDSLYIHLPNQSELSYRRSTEDSNLPIYTAWDVYMQYQLYKSCFNLKNGDPHALLFLKYQRMRCMTRRLRLEIKTLKEDRRKEQRKFEIRNKQMKALRVQCQNLIRQGEELQGVDRHLGDHLNQEDPIALQRREEKASRTFIERAKEEVVATGIFFTVGVTVLGLGWTAMKTINYMRQLPICPEDFGKLKLCFS